MFSNDRIYPQMTNVPAKETAWQTWIASILDPKQHVQLDHSRRFRLDSSWSILPRTHDRHVLYSLVSGDLETTIDQRHMRWHPGDAFLLGPGTPHEIHLPEGQKQVVFDAVRFHVAVAAPCPWYHLVAFPSLSSTIDVVHSASRLPGACQSFRIRAALAGLMAVVVERIVHQQGGLKERDIARILDLAQGNSLASPENLAQAVGLPLHTFRRRFTTSFGENPRSWLSRERLRHAAELMAQGSPSVEEMARQAGYTSVSSFSRLFTQTFGVAPAKWRQKIQ